MNFLSYLINGISLGSVYAIIALGYTMVYGIAKMLNFAHGDVIMIGCYVVFLAMNGQGWPPLVAVVLSVIVCTLTSMPIKDRCQLRGQSQEVQHLLWVVEQVVMRHRSGVTMKGLGATMQIVYQRRCRLRESRQELWWIMA